MNADCGHARKIFGRMSTIEPVYGVGHYENGQGGTGRLAGDQRFRQLARQRTGQRVGLPGPVVPEKKVQRNKLFRAGDAAQKIVENRLLDHALAALRTGPGQVEQQPGPLHIQNTRRTGLRRSGRHGSFTGPRRPQDNAQHEDDRNQRTPATGTQEGAPGTAKSAADSSDSRKHRCSRIVAVLRFTVFQMARRINPEP
jgi:hypothetical protein